MLAGQWMPYLEQVFADWASGDRSMLDDKMKEKTDLLSAADIDALIHFYGSQQCPPTKLKQQNRKAGGSLSGAARRVDYGSEFRLEATCCLFLVLFSGPDST